ncbi:hypothetical protein FQN60_004430 [Etheostoma spectabile]|uniref:U2A'/phosphoprotein 32 family A C-terminal domain-containing protein n=1 Tax=Etheostoma spectabile TaxID=54343 RepID=A0A5J5CYG2_9PERO|nr:hypothetical protein FQN60_004430 [Etheostoma spectabile]
MEILQKAVVEQAEQDPQDQAGLIVKAEEIHIGEIPKLRLEYRNLSLSSVEKSEGLESLRKLEVLDLSNNRISVVENMDTLEKIPHFFIANKLIGKLAEAACRNEAFIKYHHVLEETEREELLMQQAGSEVKLHTVI